MSHTEQDETILKEFREKFKSIEYNDLPLHGSVLDLLSDFLLQSVKKVREERNQEIVTSLDGEVKKMWNGEIEMPSTLKEGYEYIRNFIINFK